MANEFYTLIVVPHAKARFRKFQVSVRLTQWVLAAFGVMALILAGILAHYTWIAVEVAEVRRLRVENLALADQGPGLRGKRRAAPGQGAAAAERRHEARHHGRASSRACPTPPSAASAASSRSETTPPSVDIASTLQSLDQTVGEPLREVQPRSRPTSRTSGSCWPRPPRSGRCAATSRRDSATGPTPSRACATSTPASTSRSRAAPRSSAPADGVVVFCGTQAGYGNAHRSSTTASGSSPATGTSTASTSAPASASSAAT